MGEQTTADDLTDRGAVALAAVALLGAWGHRPVPLVLGVAVAGVALLARRPWLLGVGVLLLASELGHRAIDGLEPAEPRRFDDTVTLVQDPVETRFGVRVDVRVKGKRLELRATSAPAGTLLRARAGERLHVVGRVAPPPPGSPWLVPRHVVGRLSATRIEPVDGGSWPWRAANRFRALLVDGAAGMPETARSLYGGFVLGDDRGQPPEVVDDFRAAGLTHLLVVSGQNVAFVLVLAGPALMRLRLGWRWTATLGLIAAFGVLTRFEPSVLRASAMAAIAATATFAGRPAATLRVLALAVTALVLIDPLLVHSIAFQLSTGASLGIAVLSAPITARLRGPTAWRDALAVTIAAQIGVAPILLPRFGGIPVVSLPANLLAVPIAGLVTTWGLPAGIVAGFGGDRVGAIVHLPTEALIAWVASVARHAARAPLGELGPAHALALLAASAGYLAIERWGLPARRPRQAIVAIALLVALTPTWQLRHPPSDQTLPGGHRVLRVDGTTTLVLHGRPWADDLLEGLRLAGVRRIDRIIASEPPPTDVLRALRHRWPLGPITIDPDVAIDLAADLAGAAAVGSTRSNRSPDAGATATPAPLGRDPPRPESGTVNAAVDQARVVQGRPVTRCRYGGGGALATRPIPRPGSAGTRPGGRSPATASPGSRGGTAAGTRRTPPRGTGARAPARG